MSVICQECGTQSPTWSGSCTKCGCTKRINLAAEDPLVGKLIDRYRIKKKLGAGAMGSVYLAEEDGLGQLFAIKFLNPELSANEMLVRRFLNEAKSYARLQHPNAVHMHGFGQDPEGRLYIAMEHVDGISLADRLRTGPLPLRDALEIAAQICDVLGQAHSKEIVHRDLKPANIMIIQRMRGFHVKVLDFGIAKLLDEGTLTGAQVLGTPAYMSPEQAMGKPIDHRSDIYALGLVLFELLAGKRPLPKASSSQEMLRIQVEVPVPRLASVGVLVPEALEDAIQKAVAKRPDDRFASMKGLHDALEGVLSTLSGEIPLGDATIVAAAPARRTSRAGLVIGVVALAAAGVAGGAVVVTSLGVPPAAQVQPLPIERSQAPAARKAASPGPLRQVAQLPETPPAVTPEPAQLAREKAPSPPAARAVEPPVPPAAPPARPVPAAPGRIEVRKPEPAAIARPARPPLATPAAARPPPVKLAAALVPPPPEAKQAAVTLRIVTRLEGKAFWASVSIDGKRWPSPTPASIPLPPGEHAVRIERDGFQVIEQKVVLKGGEDALLKLELSR